VNVGGVWSPGSGGYMGPDGMVTGSLLEKRYS
jgi:hypothetical protein